MRTTVQLANILCTVLFTPDFLGNRGLDFLLEQPPPKRYMNRKVEGKEASEQFKERGRTHEPKSTTTTTTHNHSINLKAIREGKNFEDNHGLDFSLEQPHPMRCT